MREDDAAVAGVVAAILIVAAVTAFIAVVRTSWLPAWEADAEANHSDEVRAALATFADTAEDRVARSLVGQTFSRGLPVGEPGLSIPLLSSAPARAGVASVVPGPSLTLSLGGATLLTASGGLNATTLPLHFPSQTFAYELGALEVNQSTDAWVDLRSFLHANRTTSGKMGLSLEVLTLTGANQSVSSSGTLQVEGTVSAANTSTQGAGNVRILISNVAGDSWRAAVTRVMNAAAMTGETRAGTCAASTKSSASTPPRTTRAPSMCCCSTWPTVGR